LLAHEVERGDLALTFRDHPMLDPNRLAADRIRPARDIARSENSRRAGPEIGVDNDAPIHSEARRLGLPDTRAHAKPRDDEIGLDQKADGDHVRTDDARVRHDRGRWR
jgi:hypothetical protein